jgi:hypothetical protein
MPARAPTLHHRGWPGHRAPAHSLRRPTGISGAAQHFYSSLARPLCCPVRLLAYRDCGYGRVEDEVKAELRNLAHQPHVARGYRRRCGRTPHGGMGLLSCLSLEARIVDRHVRILGRAAFLCQRNQAMVSDPPALPRRRGAQGTRRYSYAGDAAGRSSWRRLVAVGETRLVARPHLAVSASESRPSPTNRQSRFGGK